MKVISGRTPFLGMSILWEFVLFPPIVPRAASTQVGACIVSPDHKILSMGYNGFPKGCSDDIFPWAKMKAEQDPYNAKYFYVTHAELNAILNYRGGSLEGPPFMSPSSPVTSAQRRLSNPVSRPWYIGKISMRILLR